MDTPIIPQKQCSRCKDSYLETNEFFRFNKKRNHFEAMCLKCLRESGKKSTYNRRHKDMDKAREKGREEQQIFRANNKEKLKIKDRERRKRRLAKDPELERAKARAKYKKKMLNNPQKLRDKGIRNNAKRKVRRLKNVNDTDFTTQDVQVQLKTQNGLCWWCGKKLNGKYHVDHRIPIARGGHNGATNICISCPTCNCSKNDKMPWEWNGRLV